MQKTFPVIRYGDQFAVKDDAVFDFVSGAAVESISNAGDLNNDVANFEKYITGEKDWWLLDGSMKIAPVNAKVGYLSDNASSLTPAAAGEYAITSTGILECLLTVANTIPLLERLVIDFGEYSETYPVEMELSFYNAALSLITDGSLEPDSVFPDYGTFENGKLTLFLDELFPGLANVRQVDIRIASTGRINKPGRMLRILHIEIGDVTVLMGEALRSAKIVEEVDPLSLELSINTCAFEMYTENEDLFIYNDGVELKEGQPFDVHEYSNAVSYYMGRFYVNECKSKVKNWLSVTGHDAIGLLSSTDTEYLGDGWGRAEGEYYGHSNPTTIGDLIEKILDGTEVEYSLDAGLAALVIDSATFLSDLGGVFLFPMSPKDALQVVAFVIGATVSCAKSNVVNIYPYEEVSTADLDFEFDATQKSFLSEIALLPIIGKVEINAFVIHAGNENLIDAYNASVTTGFYRVVFDGVAAATFTTPGTHTATITGFYSNPNFMQFTVTVPGVFHYQIDNQLIFRKSPYSVERGDYSPSRHQKISIQDVTMITLDSVEDITQRVFDYYQERHTLGAKLIQTYVSAGHVVTAPLASGKIIRGRVEKNEIDLSAGFINAVKIKGIAEDV